MFGFGSKLRVGLDIGSHSLKIAVVEKVGPRFRLVKWKCNELYTGGDRYDPEGPKKSVAVPMLMKTMGELGLVPKRVNKLASCIGGAQVAAKEIASVMQTEEEMNSNIQLEARKHLPLDGSDTVVDFQIMGDDPDEPDKLRVLLVATTRKLHEGHQDYLREIDLKPGIIDIETLAILNSYIINSPIPEDGVIIFLHVGAKRSVMTVFGRRDRFFTRDLNISGMSFTEELMTKYGLDYETAEDVKKTQGMDPDLPLKDKGEEGGLTMAEKGMFEKLGDEINRSLRYYVKETGQSVFTHFVLTGGGAGLKGLDIYLNNKFNLPMEIYNPFNQLDSRVPIDDANAPQMAAAIGLAIRGDL